ncbi:unnamed protein product [Nezara viridula]|uniref:Uncharacterized protein n=1 Tax=Nezara viridula TaxID=85310 RepID=A0A9P0HDD2_NEZVI|nr:unnamed protein product [Nezara viridula]
MVRMSDGAAVKYANEFFCQRSGTFVRPVVGRIKRSLRQWFNFMTVTTGRRSGNETGLTKIVHQFLLPL